MPKRRTPKWTRRDWENIFRAARAAGMEAVAMTHGSALYFRPVSESGDSTVETPDSAYEKWEASKR
jgi:hypothetical protein